MRKFAAAVVLLSGCYLQYPKLPKSKPLTVVPGATAEISKRSKGVTEDCGISETGECAGSDRKHTRFTAGYPTYNGERVTHYQFKMLVDPDFAKRMDHIRALKSTCTISLAPTILAIGALGAALYFVNNKDDENSKRNSGIAVGVGVGLYALSYPLGGYACVRARKEFREAHMTGNNDEDFVSNDDNGEYIKLLQDQAARFNASAGATPPEEPAEPEPDSPPAD